MTMPLKFILTANFVASIFGLIYGFLWLMQTASLSGAPNYPIERAHYNANGAYTLMAVSVLVAVVPGTLLYKQKKNRNN